MPRFLHTFVLGIARFCAIKSYRQGGRRYPSGGSFPFSGPGGNARTIRRMNGLMMDFPLTVAAIFRRAEQLFRRREIVWRNADKSVGRYTFADFTIRARRLGSALESLGVRPGDRVATLAWNHGAHLRSEERRVGKE